MIINAYPSVNNAHENFGYCRRSHDNTLWIVTKSVIIGCFIFAGRAVQICYILLCGDEFICKCIKERIREHTVSKVIRDVQQLICVIVSAFEFDNGK